MHAVHVQYFVNENDINENRISAGKRFPKNSMPLPYRDGIHETFGVTFLFFAGNPRRSFGFL